MHRNDRRHLHVGIPAADDEAMCWLYDQVVSHGYSLFCPPDGALSQDVITMWVDKLCGSREGRHNAERTMIFPTCVLARERRISGATAIRRRIDRHLHSRKDGCVAELAEDIVALVKGQEGAGRAPHPMSANGACVRGARGRIDDGGGITWREWKGHVT